MNEYNPNDIVKWSKDKWGRCWSVVYQWTDGHARPVGTTIIEYGTQRTEVNDKDIRRLTFREFIWFEHPTTLHMMSGKTRGYMAIIIHLFALGLCAASVTTCFVVIDGKYVEFDPTPLIGAVISIDVLLLYWWGTFQNWRGKWV